MTQKLKHLSKYCCRPETETEYEAVKMAAELGGVEFHKGNEFRAWEYFGMSTQGVLRVVMMHIPSKNETKIPVLEFFRKLRMTESEAQALEDDRVELFDGDLRVNHIQTYDRKSYIANDGYVWETRNNGKECYLVKDKPNV